MENRLEYYLCSKEVVEHFPDLEKSNPFKSGYDYDVDVNYFVVATSDFISIEKYYKQVVEPYNEQSNCPINFWMKLVGESAIDASAITLKQIRKCGLFYSVGQELGLTKEENQAYAIYDLSKKYKQNPIDFINRITQ